MAADCPIPAPSWPGAAPAGGLKLRLVWVDVGGASGAAFQHAAEELARLFGEQAIEIEWRQARAGEQAELADLHVIVLETSPGVPGRVMGAAKHAETPPHTVRVFLRHVRKALGFGDRPTALLRPNERVLLGRAIGRVIAHEIVHAYAPEHGHENEGLMRASLDDEFLKREQVHLEAASVTAMKNGLAGGSTGTAVLAPTE